MKFLTLSTLKDTSHIKYLGLHVIPISLKIRFTVVKSFIGGSTFYE